MSTYESPDGYSTPIAQMRTAEAKPPTALEQFEKDYQFDMGLAHETEYYDAAATDAAGEQMEMRLAAADDGSYAPPDPYGLQSGNKRRNDHGPR
jgi:hypothetical protein